MLICQKILQCRFSAFSCKTFELVAHLFFVFFGEIDAGKLFQTWNKSFILIEYKPKRKVDDLSLWVIVFNLIIDSAVDPSWKTCFTKVLSVGKIENAYKENMHYYAAYY